MLTTDYVYRGLTQSGRKAALQADAHLQELVRMVSRGLGLVSPSSHPERAEPVRDQPYLGSAWVLSPNWTANAHYARYIYPDGRERGDYYYERLR